MPPPSSDEARGVIADRHLRGADKNLDFAGTLVAVDSPEPHVVGWAITALFYAAVHYVRGYLLAQHQQPVTSHDDMKDLVPKYPELRRTSDDYDELRQQSQSARYYLNPDSTKDDYFLLRRTAAKIRNTWKPRILKALGRAAAPAEPDDT